MSKLSISNVEVASRRVLTRVDFNVPFDENGAITDDARIRAALPTIRSVIDRGGRLILMSHLGRPKNGYDASLSLKPVAEHLALLLSVKVTFPSTDCTDATTAKAVRNMADGEIVVLENLRFHPGETTNDADFARQLADLGQVYCNDAFGTAHRNHASMVAVPLQMSAEARAAGLLLIDEIRYLADLLEAPASPFVVVLGGAKVSDKIKTIDRLLNIADQILIGGAMAYTFLKVVGRRVGDSLVEKDRIDDARAIIERAAELKADLFLPNDHVGAREISEHSPVEVFTDHIDDGWMGLDIGPKTQERYATRVSTAKTIVWNGPLGVFETPPFNVGTEVIATAAVQATRNGATSVIGGGDTAAALRAVGLSNAFSHVSTGGGASLVMLEGGPMPGIDVLTNV